jgi:hypothetical protein
MPPNRATYPQRLRPPARVLAQWGRRGKATGDRGYARRWAEFWKKTVLAAQQQPGWKDDDLHLVAEYVRRCRLTELHAEEAELDPYPANPDSGFVRPHPGWERSLGEAREARATAAALGLLPSTRVAAGIDVPKIDNPRGTGGAESEAGGGWVDNQVDAGGKPL